MNYQMIENEEKKDVNKNMKHLKRYIGANEYIQYIAISPDESLLACDTDGDTVNIWHITSGKQIRQLSHEASINEISISHNSKYLVSAYGRYIKIWKIINGELISKII